MRESVSVKEVFEGETAWQGVVEVFALEDHPTAKLCYAWSHRIDHSRKRCFFAVLHEGPQLNLPKMLYGWLSLMNFVKRKGRGRSKGRQY
jgi:hypothetical protein